MNLGSHLKGLRYKGLNNLGVLSMSLVTTHPITRTCINRLKKLGAISNKV